MIHSSRRAFIALFALAALAACKKPAETTEADAAAPATSAAAPKDKDLVLFAWSEYVPQNVLDGFEKETGIKVHYETFSSNEEMLSKMGPSPSAYDVIQPSDYVVEMLSKKGALAKLDRAKLTNLGQIGKGFRGLPHDPDLTWSVPYMGGVVGIVVNTDKVKDGPIKGYKDVFKPSHKGRIVVVKDNREIVSWAMKTQGLDVNQPSKENLDKVKGTLKTWVPMIKVFDSDSPKTALLNGDVDLGVVWNGEAAVLLNSPGAHFQFVLPEEGAHLYVDSLCIPAKAPHKEAAHAFLDYILRPEISKLISEKFPYTNPNDGARKLLPPAALANAASYPPIEGLTTFRDIGKSASDIDKLMTELTSQ